MGRIGEFYLIDRLTSFLNIDDPSVVVGFGDDCACVKIDEKLILFSGDVQIEGSHFLKGKIKPEDLGWKLVSVNVSDIVSCGGLPRWSLISISFPVDTEVSFLEGIYKGIRKALGFYSFSLIGGNTAKSKEIILDFFIVGETKRFVSRGGGKSGDILFLSGYTGLSRAGLELLLMDKTVYEKWELEIIRNHTNPRARIDFQPLIEKYANACIDISDGLAGDAGHIEKRSKVKIVLDKEKLPVHPLLKKYCEKYKKDPLEYVLFGGEDYQLLFSVPKKYKNYVKKGFQIGFLEEGEGLFLKEKGSLIRLPEKGFEHI